MQTILHPHREYHATITVDCARFNVPIRVEEITKRGIGESFTYKDAVYTLEIQSMYSEYVVFTYNNMRVYLNLNKYTLI